MEPDPAMMDAGQLYKAIKVINHLAVELDVDLAVESMRKCVLELLECEKVTLFLINEGLQELRGKTCDQADDLVIAVKFGEGIAGTVAQNGGLMNLPDAYSHPLFNPDIDRQTRYTTRNILCCAIADTSDRNVAVLQALNKWSGSFTRADEHMLQLFGVHLGNTLTKSRYYEEAKCEKLRLATLSNCFKQLSAVTTLNGALDTIAAAARELVSARHVVVLLMDHARQTLWTSIMDNQNMSGPSLSFRVKEGQGVLAQCAADKQQVAMCLPHEAHPDTGLLKLFEMLSKGRSKLSDVLLQPVVDPAGDKCLAVLCALNKQERSDTCSSLLYEQTFTPSDCEALNLFSMEVADVLSARSLEVSFASAMSVAGNSATAAQEQISSMLKAQLMDYAPQQGNAELSRGNSCQLQHSTTLPAPSRLCSGSCSGFLTALDDTMFRSLRRTSSTAASESTASSGTAAVSPLSTMRSSFHHHLPPWAGLRSASVTASTITKYTSWELDCSTMSTDELVRMAYDLFMLSGVLEDLQLPESGLNGFLNAVASHYHHEVPYHNLTHAVQVLHTVWMILESTSIRHVLSPGEELVLLIAAICHDLDHDGFSNSFHINSQSDLAQRYNDRSVQENHHCALTFHILRQQGSNLLQRFTGPDWHQARRLLVDAILGTDMQHHFALTQELQKHGLMYIPEEEADRLLLMKAVLHAADISNPARPFDAALAAAERVHLEFQRQVRRERELGLPVAPHMVAEEPAVWAKMEVQFIDYVAGPLWERLGQVFPNLQEPICTMCVNRGRFAAMAESSPDLVTPKSEEQEQPASIPTTYFGVSNGRRSNKLAAVAVPSRVNSRSNTLAGAAIDYAAAEDGSSKSHATAGTNKQP